jgi:hypothetical protein
MANSNGWGDGAANNAIGWGQGANNAIGWGDIHADSWAGLTDISGLPTTDPDAQAFITAASITDPTQQAAINTLVTDLKGYSIWSKFSAIYPFVGGTATTHKFNLKNPLDTNAAFRLFFSGGGTHSVNGYQTNGVNAFAETYYNPSTNLSDINSNHISIYSRTNNVGGIDMGGGFGSVLVDLELNYASTSYNWNMAANFSHTNSNSTGFYVNTRTASNAFKLLKNGSTVLGSSTGAAGATKPNITYHIGKRNYDSLWTNRQYAFASIGDGLTDTEAANFYTAVQAFQTTLGRSIGTQTVSDADAQAFVTNAGIVDQVEANAINNLVIGLKADSLWTKMKAVYPFVGGTSTTMKYNLVNPLDTDAAYRLLFSGGWTHSSTGATPNGTNGYADTFVFPNVSLGKDQLIGYYLGTDNSGGIEVGSTGGNAMQIYTKLGTLFYLDFPSGTADRTTFTNSNSKGNYTIINNSTLGRKVYKNGSSVSSTAFVDKFIEDNNTRKLNIARNTYGNYGQKEFRMFYIATGFTSLTEITNLQNRIETFQTALNRNV